ncbi:MAG: hypothetical protein UZ01_01798 [Candidatus Brocadia sinica]|nr:MAG: hypothetical protein UZ01_01798 [Candidatus Brocadia sinica]
MSITFQSCGCSVNFSSPEIINRGRLNQRKGWIKAQFFAPNPPSMFSSMVNSLCLIHPYSTCSYPFAASWRGLHYYLLTFTITVVFNPPAVLNLTFALPLFFVTVIVNTAWPLTSVSAICGKIDLIIMFIFFIAHLVCLQNH